MKTSVRFQAIGVATMSKNVVDPSEKDIIFTSCCENTWEASLLRMNEELVCQGRCPSLTGVGILQFPLNSFDSVFRQPQNCKRVCCELTGNTI